MLAQFCSACSLLPCPVNLNRSVGGQLMEAAEVSVAKAFRQLGGGGARLWCWKSHRYLLLSPASVFLLCTHVCVCVLPAGFKGQHQTLTSQSLWAGERRLCQDVQHQKVGTMSLLINSYLVIKNHAHRHTHTQGNLGILKWFVLIVADISVPLWSTHDFDAKKGNGWFQVKNHQKKKILFFLLQSLILDTVSELIFI